MKPTFETSRPSRLSDALRPLARQTSQRPVTDWSFQSSALQGGTAPFHPGVQQPLHPAFHTLSQAFFASEADRESRFEGALFGIMVGLAVWPMALAAQAALVFLRVNYVCRRRRADLTLGRGAVQARTGYFRPKNLRNDWKIRFGKA